MPRVKRGKIATKKRERLLKYVKGFKWGRKSKERLAKEALLHAWSHAFRGRKEEKRYMRRLWQVQINAASRQNNLKYSKLANLLRKNNIALNRKILAQIAKEHPAVFSDILQHLSK